MPIPKLQQNVDIKDAIHKLTEVFIEAEWSTIRSLPVHGALAVEFMTNTGDRTIDRPMNAVDSAQMLTALS